MLALLKERGYVSADTRSVSSTVSKIYEEEVAKEFAGRVTAAAPEPAPIPAAAPVAGELTGVKFPVGVFVKSKDDVVREREEAKVAAAAAVAAPATAPTNAPTPPAVAATPVAAPLPPPAVAPATLRAPLAPPTPPPHRDHGLAPGAGGRAAVAAAASGARGSRPPRVPAASERRTPRDFVRLARRAPGPSGSGAHDSLGPYAVGPERSGDSASDPSAGRVVSCSGERPAVAGSAVRAHAGPPGRDSPSTARHGASAWFRSIPSGLVRRPGRAGGDVLPAGRHQDHSHEAPGARARLRHGPRAQAVQADLRVDGDGDLRLDDAESRRAGRRPGRREAWLRARGEAPR